MPALAVRTAAILGVSALVAACGAVHSSAWISPEKQRRGVHTAVVVPLENLTQMPDAGQLVTDLLSGELSSRSLSVIGRGQVEAALSKVDLVPGGTVDRLAARRLGEIFQVDAVAFGSVAEAGQNASSGAGRHASVGVTLRMVDVKTGEYLLAGSYAATVESGSVKEAARRAVGEIGKAFGP